MTKKNTQQKNCSTNNIKTGISGNIQFKDFQNFMKSHNTNCFMNSATKSSCFMISDAQNHSECGIMFNLNDSEGKADYTKIDQKTKLEKRKRNDYTFADCGLKAGDEIYFYPLDSAFKNKYTDGYKLIISDPNKNTVSDPKIKDATRNTYKSIAEFVYYKFEDNIKLDSKNNLRSMNCKNWTITKETQNKIPNEIKNDPKKLSKYVKEHSLYSIFKK